MLWCALYLHQLPLEIFQRTLTQNTLGTQSDLNAKRSPRHPHYQQIMPPSGHLMPMGLQLAVCDRLKVLMSSVAAQALGVNPGVKRATAMALAPDIALLDRNLGREQTAISQVATWALQFTPSVCLEEQGLVMEIEPSLRLFGGLDHLITLIKTGLETLGFSARISCAGTPLGAWLLAQSSNGDGVKAELGGQLNMRLANLPITLLPQSRPHINALEAMGARTIKDLLQLPRAGLSRRFGKTLLDDIDKALGRQPDLREYFDAPLEFHSKLELMAQVETSEALLFAARRMLVELVGWLCARHCAVKSFQLVAEHDDRGMRPSPPTVFEIHFSEPTREIARLSDLLREKLNVLTLREPAHTLHLHCIDVEVLPSASGHLFVMTHTTQQSLGRLVEKLQTRLGSTQVQQIQLKSDYRPESAFTLSEFSAKPTPDKSVLNKTTPTVNEPEVAYIADDWVHGLPRPLWLLASPIALEERNQRPYCKGQGQGALQLLAGPERIEGGWWDNHFVQRDYFIAEDVQNNLYWIYRERGNSTQNSDPGWFMQGRFG
jgi:protein ImuB